MIDYSDIKQTIATNLPDNNNREITAAKLRDTLNEFVDKVEVTETGIEQNINTKTSVVYNGEETKSEIIITDDSANINAVINLDSIAYENLTYRDIFETNNLLGIAPGFENGSYSPLTINTGTPEITTEDVDSGVYSLKIDGTSSIQLKSNSTTPVGLYFYACRAKCTRYVTGKLGITLGSNAAVLTSVTQDYKTCVNSFNVLKENTYRLFIGSMDSADLTGYIDTPVAVDSSIFTEIPTINKFTELYNNYVSIKKYSEITTELVTLETKKSNRITVLSENIGEEVGYISIGDGLYHNASDYYQGELINISSIKGEYIKLIPRKGIPDTNPSAFALLKDNILQDGEVPNFADNWSVKTLVSPTELSVPSDANYLWVYTYRDSAEYIYVAPYIEIPTKYALSILWEKQHPLHTYTDALGEFISEMNAKASRLGMTSTRFTSPSGLDYDPSTANYSTAKDMLKLMIEALSYPRLMKVWGMPSWTMKVYGAKARDIELESTVTNPAHDPNLAILLNNYNILGGKTGSITVEGVAYYNYCVIAEKNNKFIVATLYKASSSSGRYSQMKTLLDNAFGLLNDSSYVTTPVNAKCACCELPNVPTSILQNHLPTIIYSEGENDKVFIASTTKIMTCIIACEVLKNLDQIYYVKTDDVGGSGDDLNPGDIASFEDMMMDTMLPSSNGCAHCIARVTGNVLLENKMHL